MGSFEYSLEDNFKIIIDWHLKKNWFYNFKLYLNRFVVKSLCQAMYQTGNFNIV